MTINNKTLTTVEGLVTNSATTEGNFRTGVGDVLIEVNNLQENASSGLSCSQLFEHPGSYTYNAPVAGTYMIEVIGAGGGGGAAAAQNGRGAYACGGSGGGYSRTNAYVMTAGQLLTITVGAGGTSAGFGASSGTQQTVLIGGTGGTSTVTGTNLNMNCLGGSGGLGAVSNSVVYQPLALNSGGTASGGDVNLTGLIPAQEGGISVDQPRVGASGTFTSGRDGAKSGVSALGTATNTQGPVNSVDFTTSYGTTIGSFVQGSAIPGYTRRTTANVAVSIPTLQSARGCGGPAAAFAYQGTQPQFTSATGGIGGDGFVLITLLNI